MRRRDFTIGLAVAAGARAVRAQQPKGMPRVGILSDETRSVAAEFFEPPFVQALQALGWVDGLSISFERRYAERKYEILPSLAAELISLRPDVILAIGTPAARAAKSATQTIPIVFARVGDPVGIGLVPALARPGGNLTGVSILTKETGAKRLELQIATVPSAKRAGVLWNPSNPSAKSSKRRLGS